ncbi:MAG: OFA family MFS transporter [Eubacteriales bacterium]
MHKNKLYYIPAGVIILLCLGTVYSWSVFRKPLEEYYNINATQSGLPYMIFLASYALFMLVAGGFIEKYGPRKIIIIGGLLVGSGWILSSFAPNIYVFTLTYGFIGGSGVGIAYGAPIAAVTKWFPEKKGAFVGTILLGFGLSPFITAPISRNLIESQGVMSTLTILGVVFIVIISLLGLLFEFPNTSNDKIIINREKIFKKLFKDKKFYGIWSCFVLGTFVGLMMIGITSTVGEELIGLTASRGALFVSLFALFNGIGRPFFGWLTDYLSPKKAAIFSYCLIIIASVLMLFASKEFIFLYVIAFSLFWLNVGAWLAIAPTSTAIYFGQNNYSKYFGYVFTAYGVGAILGNLLSGEIKNIFGSYSYIFPIVIVVGIIGIILALLLLED